MVAGTSTHSPLAKSVVFCRPLKFAPVPFQVMVILPSEIVTLVICKAGWDGDNE